MGAMENIPIRRQQHKRQSIAAFLKEIMRSYVRPTEYFVLKL